MYTSELPKLPKLPILPSKKCRYILGTFYKFFAKS